MAGIDLGKQIGPLPLGAWIAIVGVGLGIAYYTRGGESGSFSGDEDDIIEPEFVEDISGDEGVGEGGFTYTPPPVVTPEDNSSPSNAVDNDEWGRRVIAKMIGEGYDAGWVNAAINKALSGDGKMSVREWAIWRESLRRYGPPPYPINVRPPTSVPGPKKPDKSPPKKTPPRMHGRWYRSKAAPLPGSTLRGIAKMAYGDPSQWHRIYNANKKGRKLPHHPGDKKSRQRHGQLTNPNVLRPGILLYIPR